MRLALFAIVACLTASGQATSPAFTGFPILPPVTAGLAGIQLCPTGQTLTVTSLAPFALGCASITDPGSSASPDYFVLAGAAADQNDSPKVSEFVATGIRVTGQTYNVDTVQRIGRTTRLLVEIGQHVAQVGAWGLWITGGPGLTAGQALTGDFAAGAYLTYGNKSGWFVTVGARAIRDSAVAANQIQSQVLFGVGRSLWKGQ